MDKPLKDIDIDVVSVNQSCSWTAGSNTSFSSLRGLGTLSGKAIMAIGNFAVRGMEWLTIQAKLRKIGGQLNSEDGFVPPHIFDDLLELQRYVCVQCSLPSGVMTRLRL